LGIVPPIGHYEKGKTFNNGENRWKGIVQLDGIYEFYPTWRLAGSIDATFYADHVNGGTSGHAVMTQENSYQVQPWIRHELSSASSIAVGYSQLFGGRQYLDGLMDGTLTKAKQIRMEVTYAPIQVLFLALQLTRDIDVEGGFKESLRLSGRATYVF
jgi:hypothetical protein